MAKIYKTVIVLQTTSKIPGFGLSALRTYLERNFCGGDKEIVVFMPIKQAIKNMAF